MAEERRSRPRKGVLRDNPPTAIANDGKTVLRRYRVDGVIYARNVREARSRLLQDAGCLDDAMVAAPSPQSRTGGPSGA